MSRFIGKRVLQGLTNQSLTTPLDIQLEWLKPDGTTFNATGFAIITEGSLKHGADKKTLKDQKGNRCAVFSTDEYLTLDVVAIAADTTLALSLLTASVP